MSAEIAASASTNKTLSLTAVVGQNWVATVAKAARPAKAARAAPVLEGHPAALIIVSATRSSRHGFCDEGRRRAVPLGWNDSHPSAALPRRQHQHSVSRIDHLRKGCGASRGRCPEWPRPIPATLRAGHGSRNVVRARARSSGHTTLIQRGAVPAALATWVETSEGVLWLRQLVLAARSTSPCGAVRIARQQPGRRLSGRPW